MANGVLFIGNGYSKVGRENQASELFGQAISFWRRQQEQKAIESFEVVLLQPSGGDLSGFFLVRGDPAKLGAIRISDDFLELEVRAVHCLEGVRVISGRINEGLQKAMEVWGKHIPAR